ncbi:MAG: restriction endonuclease [Verrucomicrobiales bacterium]|nr:restriction endonuclease [Verrucomicrobiales bacterium]
MRWQATVTHRGLGKQRIITGNDRAIVDAKARAQEFTWECQYQEKLARERERTAAAEQRLSTVARLRARQAEAETRSLEAKVAIEEVRRTLEATLEVDDAIDWECLKSAEPFPKLQPEAPQYLAFPEEPNPEAPSYQPMLTFADKLIKSKKQAKVEGCLRLYESDCSTWQAAVEATQAKNEELHAGYLAQFERWTREREEFEARQQRDNEAVDKRRAEYEALEPEAIKDYCDLVLSRSDYPDSFPQDFEIEFNPETKILVVDYALPVPGNLPRVKEVKYVKSRDEFVESFVSERESNSLYDDLVYQICLRTVHELFEADRVNALVAVVFNGWVESIDEATGKPARACILSVHANRADFERRDLAHVDAKACFKDLKGVGSSKLHRLAPVAPVLSISREDKRFVASQEVAGQLYEGFNLAAMDWQDFEHLIREIFAKEFSLAGGEVKVTQASRDGGVDAVAFDPDPIRGGKTVIQAKRYTNAVGVSFVRDLYGTVMAEGASKGILVTTSDYGPDAYEFAKGKPLVLLNGANLLHLLAKHGNKARIDLKEAKMLGGELAS